MDELSEVPVEDLDLDPYRPDATVTERADHVIGILLSDEDPVRRYHTIRELQDGRLRDVSAVSLRQLRDQYGTTEAAADAVGITRQAVNELLAKAGAPGAREDRTTRDKPTYLYGKYLAAAEACAISMPDGQRPKALNRWSNLYIKASQTLTMFPAVDRAAQQWLKSIRVHQRGAKAEARAHTLSEYAAKIGEWVAIRSSDPHLTVKEQFEVQVGYHHGRVQLRDVRKPGK